MTVARATAPEVRRLDVRVSERVHEVVARGELEVPPLGDAVVRLLEEARRPNADARRVVDIIRRDAALAANLMKLANSATYAGHEPAASLNQVVVRIGTTALCELALVLATQARAFRVKMFEAEMKALFAHAFATALCAQQVARVRKRGVEEAFLAGLFHDVGRPLVLQLVLDVCEELNVAPDREALAWTATAMHAEIGAKAVENWGLGKSVAEAVRFHHDYATEASRHSAALVAFASELANCALAGPAATTDAVVGHPALAVLQLYPADVTVLLAAGPAIAAQVARV